MTEIKVATKDIFQSLYDLGNKPPTNYAKGKIWSESKGKYLIILTSDDPISIILPQETMISSPKHQNLSG